VARARLYPRRFYLSRDGKAWVLKTREGFYSFSVQRVKPSAIPYLDGAAIYPSEYIFEDRNGWLMVFPRRD